MDLSNLTPAPWFDDGYRVYGPAGDADKRNGPVLMEYKHCPDVADEDGPFVSLARNAFDVLMTYAWRVRRHPERTMAKRWWVDFSSPGFDTITAREKAGYVHYHADPFTALVETQKWYVANVEKK